MGNMIGRVFRERKLLSCLSAFRRPRMTTLRKLLLVALLSVNGVCWSQDFSPAIDAAGLIFDSTALQIRIGNVNSANEGAPNRSGAPAASLGYSPSASVSQSVRKEMLANLLASNRDPAAQSEIKQLFATDEVWREFDRLLSSYGYSSRNLADVVAAYYVGAWEIVNYREEVQPRQFKAIREQLAGTLVTMPGIVNASDAQKQQWAESMGMTTALLGSSSAALLQKGKASEFALLQAQVRQGMIEYYGIDMKGLQVTDAGFVMK